jgi:hypothetical protein
MQVMGGNGILRGHEMTFGDEVFKCISIVEK